MKEAENHWIGRARPSIRVLVMLVMAVDVASRRNKESKCEINVRIVAFKCKKKIQED